jgi:hypothetical protein
MNPRVFITIDTEEDNWGAHNETTGTVKNIDMLPRLQVLFDQYGAIPTYLINYPVASQAQSIEILSSLLSHGHCEIGTHCHPWNTPPTTQELGPINSMMCNLDYDLLLQKMRFLHDTIQQNFGVKPVTFRAGRWAMNEKVATCLEELGYKVDTSVSPFIDWSKSFGTDFSESPTQPYYFDATDIRQASKQGALLEVPATIGYCQPNFKLCHKITQNIESSPLSKLRLLGILDALKLLNFYWLSPELSNGAQMIRLSERFLKSGHTFLNMSFHSTSLLPGRTPYVKNDNDLDQFLRNIELFLQYACKNNFNFSPLSDAVNIFSRNRVYN